MRQSVQEPDIRKALDTLRAGGLILYPTDSIWGIGCDATNPEAVDKVYNLKGRSAGKSLIVLLENDSQLQSYVQEIPEVAYQLIEYTEKPLTIIYSGAKNLAGNLIASDGSVGIRVVKHPFCEALIRRFRKPIVSTSANPAGHPAPGNFSEIADEIRTAVDYVAQYGQDDDRKGKASTIMRLEPGGKFSFIRK